MSAYKPTACFDFDGVIHSYTSRWQGATVIPDPVVEGIEEVIRNLREDYGYSVVVFSTRAATKEGAKAIEEYLDENGIEVDGITAIKPPALVYVDDRAICFEGKTKNLVKQILNFKPWNKEK